MASINPAPAITWLEAKTDIDELLTPSTVLPDVSFFQSKTETHTPFSWTYLDSPARESTVGYGQQLTFPLSKIGDLTGPIFLYLKVAPLLYGPVLDAGVTRALAASQLPATPTPSLGGLSQLDLLPTFIDFMGFALTDVVEFWVLGNKIDATSGDYTFLNQDQGVDENTSWVYTLPSNQGGTQNVGTLNSQDLYVPLDLWWTRDIRTSLRHNALMYSDGVLKITLNRAPIRADALSFQNETLDPTGHKLYAATNGQDVLPEQMYQRYVELRVGAAPARITVAGSRTPISVATGCEVRAEVPRSPVSTPEMKDQYCDSSESSSPSSSRSRATCSSLALSPASTRAGSPGSTRNRKKLSTSMNSRLPSEPASLLSRYRP